MQGALKPLNDNSREMSGSGKGLINRTGNAMWGTEGLEKKKGEIKEVIWEENDKREFYK